MIEPAHPQLSVARQCALLALPRSTYYHQPEPESDANLALLRVIDETYLAYPFFGSRQMTRWLRRQGHPVNRKRVRRLMRTLGLEPSSTGTAAMCWHGSCRTPATPHFACGRCSGPWRRTACRRSSTPTKAASLPAPSLPSHSWPPGSGSRWTARAGASTTSSSNGSGAASNTRKSTSNATSPSPRPTPSSALT